MGAEPLSQVGPPLSVAPMQSRGTGPVDSLDNVVPLKPSRALITRHINRFLAEADVEGIISRAVCARYADTTGLSVRTLRRYQKAHRVLQRHLAALAEGCDDPEALRKRTAEEMGTTIPRLRRMEVDGVTAGRERLRTVITDKAEDRFAELEGNATALAEDLRENPQSYGYETAAGLSDSNVRALVRRDIGEVKRNIYRNGAVAGDKHKLRASRRTVLYEEPVREFQIDGRKVCEALLDGELVPVYVISVVDTRSAAYLGLHVTTSETADAVLLALCDAALASERSPLAGLPLGGRVTSDNGSAQTAAIVEDTYAALDIEHHRVDAFEPNQNGSVESLHALMKQRLDPKLGYRPDAPRNRGARQPWHDKEAALPFETVRRLIREFQHNTNFNRERAFLGGETSAEHFASHDEGVHQIEPDEMVWLLPAVEAKVRRYGVRIGTGLAYTHPELADLGDQSVTVRYVPGDADVVYVFHGGRFVCAATPNLTEAEASELSGRGKRLELDAVTRMQRAAAERRELAREEREREVGLPPAEVVAGVDTHSAPTARIEKKRTGLDGDEFEVVAKAQEIAR